MILIFNLNNQNMLDNLKDFRDKFKEAFDFNNDFIRSFDNNINEYEVFLNNDHNGRLLEQSVTLKQQQQILELKLLHLELKWLNYFTKKSLVLKPIIEKNIYSITNSKEFVDNKYSTLISENDLYTKFLIQFKQDHYRFIDTFDKFKLDNSYESVIAAFRTASALNFGGFFHSNNIDSYLENFHNQRLSFSKEYEKIDYFNETNSELIETSTKFINKMNYITDDWILDINSFCY